MHRDEESQLNKTRRRAPAKQKMKEKNRCVNLPENDYYYPKMILDEV
jgi:hypothetical protein